MAQKPYVDKGMCSQCEFCVINLPEVFRLDDDEYAEVHNPEGASEDEIQEAMDNCPMGSIHWED